MSDSGVFRSFTRIIYLFAVQCVDSGWREGNRIEVNKGNNNSRNSQTEILLTSILHLFKQLLPRRGHRHRICLRTPFLSLAHASGLAVFIRILILV